MIEAILSFETSVLIRATRRNIQEGRILHSHSREKLKSYILTLIDSIEKRVLSRIPAHTSIVIAWAAYDRALCASLHLLCCNNLMFAKRIVERYS
jgi:hypothetical protein